MQTRGKTFFQGLRKLWAPTPFLGPFQRDGRPRRRVILFRHRFIPSRLSRPAPPVTDNDNVSRFSRRLPAAGAFSFPGQPGRRLKYRKHRDKSQKKRDRISPVPLALRLHPRIPWGPSLDNPSALAGSLNLPRQRLRVKRDRGSAPRPRDGGIGKMQGLSRIRGNHFVR